jgi:hypothetical protein
MKLLDRGRVAQLGEHLLCKQGVAGSIPATSTNHSMHLRNNLGCELRPVHMNVHMELISAAAVMTLLD